ncbi:MAG: AAA family ATPase [Euryarchaeota archaeon]|nr:AAA family ATPase [Euryarchaeota archaeon]
MAEPSDAATVPAEGLGSRLFSPGQTNGLAKRLAKLSQDTKVARAFSFFALGVCAGLWIPFYPVWMALLIGALSGLIAYRFPILSLILGSMFATAAAASQSPEFGLVFLVVSLIVLFCSLFDWRFGLVVLLALFLSRTGLSFAVILLAAALLPVFLTVSAGITAAFTMVIVSSCANLDMLGLIVAAPHSGSFMLFYPTDGAAFLPGNILSAINSMQFADLNIISGVMAANLGASIVPYLSIFVWGFAALAMHAAVQRPKLTYIQRAAMATMASVAIALAYVASMAAFSLDVIPLPVTAAMLVAISGPALLWTALWARDHYAEHFMLQVSGGSVGRRVSEMTELGKSSFELIGGLSDVKADMKESIMVPLLRPEMARRFAIDPPKGILLFGPPGCGKTMLMKALANELRVEMITVKCSDIMSKWYGESESKIAELFETAKKRRPSIIFFDDLEAMAKNRDFYAGDDVTPRLLSIILSELDGMDRSSGMILVGTTNRPEMIDPALLRPGRFDKVIYVPPPSREERIDIIKVHLAERPVTEGLDINEVARRTERYSGADLANVVRESAVLAMKREIEGQAGSKITAEDMLMVVGRVKPSISLTMLEEYELLKAGYERKMHHIVREERKLAVPWKDIVGADRTKQDIRDYVELLLRRPDVVAGFKLKPGRGILLFGPQGCGKRLIVQASARELGLPVQQVNCSDLVSPFGNAPPVREAFQRARENSPSVIILEEIHHVASKAALESQEARRVLGQILAELDNADAKGHVLVVATTHMPQMLQGDLLRPGRFDKLFYVPAPDVDARERMFRRLLTGLPLAKDVDAALVKSLAQRADGYAGADIAAVVDEAKLIAVVGNDGGKEPLISLKSLEKAFERIHPSVTGEEMDGIEAFMAGRKVRV